MMKFFGGRKDASEPRQSDKEPSLENAAAEKLTSAEDAPKAGFFSRMKQAVSRTRESLSAKIDDLVALTRTVDEGTLESLETVLLTSDLGVETTAAILAALRERARHQAIEGGDELRDLLKEQTECGGDGRRTERYVSGGRERDGQDDLGGQAGGMVSRAGAQGAAVRRGYVSGGSD
jgi:fused signal recognition particle receptor